MWLRQTMTAFAALSALAMFTTAQPVAHAQNGDLVIYDDNLENAWQNWGWATLNYASTAVVKSGSASISVTDAAWQGMYMHHAAIDTSSFASLQFWINGGPVGGQRLSAFGLLNGAQQTAYPIGPLAANTWTQITVPLASLGVANKANLDGFWITDATGTALPTFYVDDVVLVGTHIPPRSDANVFINNAAVGRILDNRMFGLNTAIWDSQLSSAATQSALSRVLLGAMRFPAGSGSDSYDWSSGKSDGAAWTWPSNYDVFAKLAEGTRAQSYITVNYGSGTPEMAGAWVAYANGAATDTRAIGVDARGRDWKTVAYWAAMRGAAPLATDDGHNFLRLSHPLPFAAKYWEIGNECYGGWENDLHGVAGSGLSGSDHDGYTYALWAGPFFAKMRAVDPSIKIGVATVPGEDSFPNALRSAVNPNQGNAIHHGWTPVMLATLKSLRAYPDFLIHHRYSQDNAETDDGLLRSTAGWPADANSLRQMLTDYLGPTPRPVELAATETNSISSSPGKQTTSLVNGLFLADNMANLAQTEYNVCLWWDLRNGSETNHNNSSSLYGWRLFGDYGLLATGDRPDTPLNTPYPSYRALELLTRWGRGGDRLVSTTSDNPALTAYAARLQNGSMAVLVINKWPTTSLTGHISLGSFVPAAQGKIFQYGIPDDAANAGVRAAVIATTGTTLTNVFPPYSMSVIVLPPAVAPINAVLAPIADTYVGSLSATGVTHGGEGALLVKGDAVAGSAARRVAYLKFDLTGVTRPLTNAQLTLSLATASPAGRAPLSVYGVANSSWLESTLDWTSAVTSENLTVNSVSTGALAGVTTVSNTPGRYYWDLTSYLSGKTGQIVTLQVVDSSAGNIAFSFNSRESTANSPSLTLRY